MGRALEFYSSQVREERFQCYFISWPAGRRSPLCVLVQSGRGEDRPCCRRSWNAVSCSCLTFFSSRLHCCNRLLFTALLWCSSQHSLWTALCICNCRDSSASTEFSSEFYRMWQKGGWANMSGWTWKISSWLLRWKKLDYWWLVARKVGRWLELRNIIFLQGEPREWPSVLSTPGFYNYC
jgi:hypothetical protein